MIVDALVVAGENRFRAGGLTLAELAAAATAAGIEGLVAAPGRPFDYHLGPGERRARRCRRLGRHAGRAPRPGRSARR